MSAPAVADLLAPGVLGRFLADPTDAGAARRLAVLLARVGRWGLSLPVVDAAIGSALGQCESGAVLRVAIAVLVHVARHRRAAAGPDPHGPWGLAPFRDLAAQVAVRAACAVPSLSQAPLLVRRELVHALAVWPELGSPGLHAWLAAEVRSDGPLRDLAVHALGRALLVRNPDTCHAELCALADVAGARPAIAVTVARDPERMAPLVPRGGGWYAGWVRRRVPPRRQCPCPTARQVRANGDTGLLWSGSLRARRQALRMLAVTPLDDVAPAAVQEVFCLALTPVPRRSRTGRLLAAVLTAWLDAGLRVAVQAGQLQVVAPLGTVELGSARPRLFPRACPPSATTAPEERAVSQIRRALLADRDIGDALGPVTAVARGLARAGARDAADRLLRTAGHEVRGCLRSRELLRAERARWRNPPACQRLLEEATAVLLATPWTASIGRELSLRLRQARLGSASTALQPESRSGSAL